MILDCCEWLKPTTKSYIYGSFFGIGLMANAPNWITLMVLIIFTLLSVLNWIIGKHYHVVPAEEFDG